VNAQPPGGKAEIPTDAEVASQSRILDLRDKWQKLRLRWIFAVALLALTLAQIGIVDRFLWVYAENQAWDIPSSVIVAYLSATVVEVLGVLAIIVRYLFDEGRGKRKAASAA
jgi:hypothetical protein